MKGCWIVVKLKEIYFGDVEGKDEVKELRKDFTSVFYKDNQIYCNLENPKVFLIVGRKGTGKTLLAEYYKEKNNTDKNIVKLFDESAFSLLKLQTFEYNNVKDQEASAFWEYFFIVTLAQEVIKQKFWFKPRLYFKKKKLERLVKESDFRINGMSTKQGGSYNAKSSIDIKGPSLSNGIDYSEELNQTYREKKYYEKIEEIRDALLDVLKCCEVSYQFFFDDIDELEIFENNKKEQVKFIHAMIKAAKRLNVNFNEIENSTRVFILLRNDMVRELNEQTNNFNKILETNAVNLTWQYNPNIDTVEQPLSKMIIKKIRNGRPEYLKYTDDDIYKQMWPKKINNKTAIKFIIDYSFGRPRDFVMFLNVMKERFPDRETITPDMMRKAVSIYSEKFFNELRNEINRNEKKDLINQTILLIKDTGKNTFTIDDLYDTFLRDTSRYSVVQVREDIESGVLELYMYSVVGSSKKVKTEKTSFRQVDFSYRNIGIDNPYMKGYFSVHFALRSVFKLVHNDKDKEKERIS